MPTKTSAYEPTAAGASVYHPGELAVQRRMGQSDVAERMAGMINPTIPPIAAAFLADQPAVVIAATDDAGQLWATQITGPPGFAHAEDDRTIRIGALPAVGDPLRAALQLRRQIGMIAVEPPTRRRLRLNGVAEPLDDAADAGFRIHTEQVYSNCPRYITRRDIGRVQLGSGLPAARIGPALDAHQCDAVATADTFFIGSADTTGDADASHRGGNPGFVEILGPNRLRWPDYHGNAMFGTLGNIYRNPRCGLLFIDWKSGSTLQLTGTAQLTFDTSYAPPGAQCVIEFTVVKVVEITGAYPIRWGLAELSPKNPPLPA